MTNPLLQQIWPIFAAEAREHLEGITAGVLELERGAGRPDLVDAIKRAAHSLKGSAASLGLEDIERAAHAVEDCLAKTDPGVVLASAAVEAVIQAAEAIEATLDRIDSGGSPRVEGLEALAATLAGARSAAPAASAGGARPAAPADGRLLAAGAALEAYLEQLNAPDVERRAALAGEAAGAARALGEGAAPEVAAVARRLEKSFERMGAEGPDAARAAAAAAGDLVELSGLASGGPAAPPAPEPAPAVPEASAQGAGREDRSIRVPAGKVDAVTRHVEILAHGEARHERRARDLLALEESEKEALRLLEQGAAALRSGTAAGPVADGIERLRAIAKELGRLGRESLREAHQQRLTATAVREDLRALRMVPAALALEPLRRAVRDVASRLRREVELSLVGGEVRLDRRILDELKTPLLHMVRNAVDHGIEDPAARRAAGKRPEAALEVRVEQRGSRIAVVVSDDGAGLSLERIREAAVRRGIATPDAAARMGRDEVVRLVFRPGFSTAAAVTEVSGRGVGLDVVQDTVTRLQGSVDVAFTPGQGTRFTLDLPLTLAAETGVLFHVGGELAALPAEAVERVLRLVPEDLGTVAGRSTVRVGEDQVPYASLAHVLGLSPAAGAAPRSRAQTALLLSLGGRRMALAVDSVLGEQELVVATLGRRVSRVAHLAGASVLDDGRVVGVLNPAEILRRAQPAEPEREKGVAKPRIVVADDSLTTRSAMKAILEIAGFTVLPAADGEEALSLLRQVRCHLVVSDIQMPRLDGLGLTRRLKADPELSGIPVILVTSLEAADDRLAGLQAGADGYLVKREVERGKLLELVRQLLPGPA